MKIQREVVNGQDLLFIEAENEAESEILSQFDGYGQSLVATFDKHPGHHLPMIIIEKET